MGDYAIQAARATHTQQLTAFAKQKHIGRLAMWSANSDHPCPGTPNASNNCSGLGAPGWAFSKIFGEGL
jgi:hypothetical protein